MVVHKAACWCQSFLPNDLSRVDGGQTALTVAYVISIQRSICKPSTTRYLTTPTQMTFGYKDTLDTCCFFWVYRPFI